MTTPPHSGFQPLPAPIDIAVLGLGMGAVRVPQIQHTSGARLVAVCDIDESRRNAVAQKHGCPAYASYEGMLRETSANCIYILTPTHRHLEHVKVAAEAGKHVILTKPMETTLDRARSLNDICVRNGVKLVVDFQFRYHSLMRQVKAAVEQGILGELLVVESHLRWFRGPDYFHPPRGTWAGDGGGVFAIQAVHLLDLIIWMAGLPVSVRAETATPEKPIEVEEHGVVLFRFARPRLRGWATGSTLFGRKADFGIIITGTKGSVDTTRALDCDRMREPEWSFRPGCAVPPLPIPTGYPESATADMVRWLTTGTPPECAGDTGLQSMRLLDAIYRSSRSGREEEV